MRAYHLMPACVLLCSLAARGARAQQLPTFRLGDTLRIHAPGAALKHARVTFSAWGDSTLRLQRRGDTTVTVSFSQITRLDRYAGKDRLTGAINGIGIFGTIGMLAGLVIGKSAVSGCQGLFCEFDAFGYMAGGMLAGVAIGAPVGATALAPDRWRRVELPVELGFPAYRTPVHETIAFRLLMIGACVLLSRAIS
jgi:hypothetical protein